MTGARLLQVQLALIPAAAIAAGNWLVAGWVRAGDPNWWVPSVVWLVAAPLVLAIVYVSTLPRLAAEQAPAPSPVEPAERNDAPALRLLAMLQEDGRLVDFLQEDIALYSDEQVGAAVRDIHEKTRKALRECVTLEPVMAGSEGESVTVPAGFEPTSVRLVGNVSGAPPFRGVLRHPGWRATAVSLPLRHGQDAAIVAPAEVEVS